MTGTAHSRHEYSLSFFCPHPPSSTPCWQNRTESYLGKRNAVCKNLDPDHKVGFRRVDVDLLSIELYVFNAEKQLQ